MLWFEIYEIWIFELCVGLRSGWGFVIQQEEYEDLDILAVDLSQKMVDEVSAHPAIMVHRISTQIH